MQLLFLSGWYPFPADNGSKIRIYNLLRALARQHDITLISFADSGTEVNLEALKPYCRVAAVVNKRTFQPTRMKALVGFLSPIPRFLVDTYSRDMAVAIRHELSCGEYDGVVASQITTAPYLEKAQGIPKIFEEIETTIFKEQYTRAAGRWRRLRAGLMWSKTRSYVHSLMQKYEMCTVVSELERNNLREVAPDYHRIAVIPNGVDVDALRPCLARPQPKALVFNGALTWDANLDAMQYFLSEIWPGIKSLEPAATLKITGRTDGVNLGRLTLHDSVYLTGYLPDIRPTVASAWACVVPLRIGGGTRLKILEAMALGTPVISTSKGAEGLAVTPEVNILLADEPVQFVQQTIRLLHDADLRQRLAENGRRLVEEQHSWRSIGQQFNQLVDSVMHNGRGH